MWFRAATPLRVYGALKQPETTWRTVTFLVGISVQRSSSLKAVLGPKAACDAMMRCDQVRVGSSIGSRWLKARVERVHADGACDVRYADAARLVEGAELTVSQVHRWRQSSWHPW